MNAAPDQDEGSIKYTSVRRDGEAPRSARLEALNRARTVLHDLGLIGVYPNGVGYGNLSIRESGDQFTITASATGADRCLRHDQYSLVESFSVEDNRVASRGPQDASSESMTHGAIYRANPSVTCVMHVHNRAMFERLLWSGGLHTAADIAYGTPAMARAVASLVRAHGQLPVLFVMAGHDEGIVAYGSDVESVLAHLIQTYHHLQAS